MRFFFYGTLEDSFENDQTRHLRGKLKLLGPARLRGDLYAVLTDKGVYPALIAKRKGVGYVHGKIYVTTPQFGRADLSRIDSYEEFDSRMPEQSEYLRKRLTVTLENGDAKKAYAYVYNQTLPKGAKKIDSGHFAEFLSLSGLDAYTDN